MILVCAVEHFHFRRHEEMKLFQTSDVMKISEKHAKTRRGMPAHAPARLAKNTPRLISLME